MILNASKYIIIHSIKLIITGAAELTEATVFAGTYFSQSNICVTQTGKMLIHHHSK